MQTGSQDLHKKLKVLLESSNETIQLLGSELGAVQESTAAIQGTFSRLLVEGTEIPTEAGEIITHLGESFQLLQAAHVKINATVRED